MFAPKRLLLKKIKDYKINFSAFSAGMNTLIDDVLMPVKYAKKLFNYTVKDGALKTGMGFSRLKLPKTDNSFETSEVEVSAPLNNSKIKKFWHFKFYSEHLGKVRHKLIFHCDDNSLNYLLAVSPIQANFQIIVNSENNFPGDISAINYHLNGKDCLILFVPSQNRILVFDQDDFTTIFEDAPNLTASAVHNERLFAVNGETDKKTLMFSANLDPTNWNINLDEAGFIDLRDERGAINKIIPFNDYVYAFRDYGVTRISAYGSQEEFSVTQLYTSSTKIYGNSVTVCGNKILFLSRDGLYAFDGFSANKIALNFEDLIKDNPNEFCVGAFYRNKFYVALRMDFKDNIQIGCEEGEFINNALIEYDLETGNVNLLRGVDIYDLKALEEGNVSKLVATFRGENGMYFGQLDSSGAFFGQGLKAVWTSPKTNFGFANQIKIVKELLIKTQADCEVVVKSELEQKTYLVKANEKLQRIKTNVKGENIEISYVSNGGNIAISCPQITIGVVQWLVKKQLKVFTI